MLDHLVLHGPKSPGQTPRQEPFHITFSCTIAALFLQWPPEICYYEVTDYRG